MTRDDNDLTRDLPPELRGKYQKSSARFTPTLQSVMFGNTQALAKLTPTAARLAKVADDAREAWASVHDTHWSLAADQTSTAAGNLVKSATHARRRLGMVSDEWDASMTEAEKTLAGLQAKLAAALVPPNNYGQALADSEVRSLIRTAKDPQDAMRIARANPRAVATVSVEAAGLAPEVHSSIKSDYLRTTVPDEYAQFADLREAVESAGNAWSALEKESKSLINFEAADALAGRKVAA